MQVTKMAKFDPQKHHRHSIRLKGYDYTQPGAYFLTVVIWQRECLLGIVRSGEMYLNVYGSLVQNEWRRLGLRFERIFVDEFVFMPNHVHGILVVREGASQEAADGAGDSLFASPLGETNQIDNVRARQEGESKTGRSLFASPLPTGVIPKSLGAMIGAYKSTTARLINGLRRSPGAPLWQRGYYDHIIRTEIEWARTQTYIHNNPLEWDLDCENPARPT